MSIMKLIMNVKNFTKIRIISYFKIFFLFIIIHSCYTLV